MNLTHQLCDTLSVCIGNGHNASGHAFIRASKEREFASHRHDATVTEHMFSRVNEVLDLEFTHQLCSVRTPHIGDDDGASSACVVGAEWTGNWITSGHWRRPHAHVLSSERGVRAECLSPALHQRPHARLDGDDAGTIVVD